MNKIDLQHTILDQLSTHDFDHDKIQTITQFVLKATVYQLRNLASNLHLIIKKYETR